jgi:hypothetical protein
MDQCVPCRPLEIIPFTDDHWTANPGPEIKEVSMRLAPVLCAAFLFGVSFAATSELSVSAAEFGSRDEAMAMVRRVQEKFRKDGPDATFKAINGKAFVDRDLFPWVYRLSDGTNMVAA